MHKGVPSTWFEYENEWWGEQIMQEDQVIIRIALKFLSVIIVESS